MFDYGNANDNQKQAISTTEGPLLIIAGPGTGKTYTLVKRVVYLITECNVMPEEIMIAKRILATLPSLISRKYEGALYPVELVNGIASMSDYPSAKILQDFVRDLIS